MSTSAYYRTLAQDLEARCEWDRAAEAWQRAIDCYPPQHGELGARDLALMTERRDACLVACIGAPLRTIPS